MAWWNSYEMLSKLVTVLTVLGCFLGAFVATAKIRADHLKKQNDARAKLERAALDKELKEQTETAIKATRELEERTRPKPLKQRIIERLNSIDPRYIMGLRQGGIYSEGQIDTLRYDELKKLAAEPGADKFIILSRPSADAGVGFFSDGTMKITCGLELKPELLE